MPMSWNVFCPIRQFIKQIYKSGFTLASKRHEELVPSPVAISAAPLKIQPWMGPLCADDP